LLDEVGHALAQPNEADSAAVPANCRCVYVRTHARVCTAFLWLSEVLVGYCELFVLSLMLCI